MLNYWNDTNLTHTLAFMDDFRRRMDRLFNEAEPRPAQERAWPRIVLRDEGAKLQLVALLPGVLEKDLSVSLHDDLLTITASRTAAPPEGYQAHRRERAPFELSRSFSLPVKVDPDKTTAELKDGVLTLTLEKAAEAQPRQITVKAS